MRRFFTAPGSGASGSGPADGGRPRGYGRREGVQVGNFARWFVVVLSLCAIAIVLGGSVGQASPPPPIGPVQPGTAPLGGVSFLPAGDIGRPGGLTYTYSGLTPALVAQFGSLEWGPADPNGVQLAMDGAINSPGETLTFNAGLSNLANGSAVWTGTAVYPIAVAPFSIPLLTRFTMTAHDTNGPISNFIATSGYGDGATV